MRTLNRAAAEALQGLPPGAVHACTDITGFGLIGHAGEMAAASRVTVVVDAASVPLFNGVLDMARGNKSGGMLSNEQHFAESTKIDPRVAPDVVSLLYDPQTSGGLLIAASSRSADRVAEALGAAGVKAARIGRTRPAERGVLVEIMV